MIDINVAFPIAFIAFRAFRLCSMLFFYNIDQLGLYVGCEVVCSSNSFKFFRIENEEISIFFMSWPSSKCVLNQVCYYTVKYRLKCNFLLFCSQIQEILQRCLYFILCLCLIEKLNYWPYARERLIY
jgi:hypothetical protein